MMEEGLPQPDQPAPKTLSLITAWNIAKWMIMAAAIYYLWREGALSRDRLRFSDIAPWSIPLALLFLALSTAAIGLRFHCLLRCLDCPSTPLRQTKLHFSGLLVQQVGSDTAYDVMRIVGAKTMGGSGAGIFAALMMDRLLGLLALTAITMVGLPHLWSGPEWLLASAGVILFLLAVPVCFVMLHSFSEARADSLLWRIPGSGFAAAIGKSVKAYRRHGLSVCGLFALSLFAHLCMFSALFFCGCSLADINLAPMESVLAGALSTFTGVLPLPMAGLGVGEVAFGSVVARMRGVGDAGNFASVFLVNRMLLLALGAVCWFGLALSKTDAKITEPR